MKKLIIETSKFLRSAFLPVAFIALIATMTLIPLRVSYSQVKVIEQQSGIITNLLNRVTSLEIDTSNQFHLSSKEVNHHRIVAKQIAGIIGDLESFRENESIIVSNIMELKRFNDVVLKAIDEVQKSD